MKIDKTEGEFRDIIRCTLSPFTEEDPKERYASALIAALDLQFKQEEPELPKRASFGIGLNGWKMRPESDEELTDDEALYREAAARYNAVQRILGLLDRSAERCLEDGKTTNGIALRAEARAILAEERERLQ